MIARVARALVFIHGFCIDTPFRDLDRIKFYHHEADAEQRIQHFISENSQSPDWTSYQEDITGCFQLGLGSAVSSLQVL